ncbi:MAG TPA: prepilin-type N-terminal cleavage/methylation domain-containing protein [Candidatus Acidoferrales bacterium]|nr:prepilin-type N-terminal cleavage/methylation domain-containing protein [Candidatus Acidoferrales bacterium]
MNYSPDNLRSFQRPPAKRLGFTLPEMMVTMAVFSLAMAAMVGVQIFGLKVYTLSSTKLIATTGGRQLLNKLRDPIRSGSTVIVGSYGSTFTSIANGTLQVGNALLITSVTNGYGVSNSIVFYHKASDQCLYTINGNVTTKVATSITNDNCFQAEDWRGVVLTNYVNNPVIRIDLGFIQWNFSGGTSGYYDLYHLQTRVTRRPK